MQSSWLIFAGCQCSSCECAATPRFRPHLRDTTPAMSEAATCGNVPPSPAPLWPHGLVVEAKRSLPSRCPMSGIVVLYTHWRVKLLTRTWGALGETTDSALKRSQPTDTQFPLALKIGFGNIYGGGYSSANPDELQTGLQVYRCCCPSAQRSIQYLHL